MKLTAVTASLLTALILLAGCSDSQSTSPPPETPSPTASQTPATTPEATTEPSLQPSPVPETEVYYGLIVDGITYGVDLPFVYEGLFTEKEYMENPADFPWPASRFYEKSTMMAQTFLEEDGSEKLISLATWEEGKTPAGIGIGSTLEELKTAYPGELFFLNGIFDTGYGGVGIPYARMYVCYQEEDQTNRSYHFYLKDKKVVMIEVLDGLDSPRAWHGYDAPFGIEELHWEYLNDEAQTHMHYFVENEDGSETTMLDIHGTTEHHDLDGDGAAEILVYLGDGNKQGIGIYDMVGEELIFVDVNQTLGCAWSSYMGNIGNLQNDEYRTCIKVGMESGQSGDVYSYSDGVLTYECAFADVMN